MRAVAVRPASRELLLVDHREPERTRPDDVLVRVLEVGVCGTDREIAAFDYGTPPPGSDVLVIGHEAIGEVVDVGAAVEGLGPGDLVVPMVRRPCGIPSCRPCDVGRADFCATGLFTERGIVKAHGFMAERIVERERYLVPVPAELRDRGVLVEPLTIWEKAIRQIRAVQSRLPWSCTHSGEDAGWGHCHTAVVLGAGPVGLLGALGLRAAGFDTWVYSRGPDTGAKAELVRSIGARYVSSSGTGVPALAELTGGIDLVYEAVGVPGLAFDLAAHLARNGALVLTGLPADAAPAKLSTGRLMRELVLGNRVVLGSVNAGRDDFAAAVEELRGFARRWPEAIRSLVTGRFPMEQHREPLVGRGSGIKDVVTIAS